MYTNWHRNAIDIGVCSEKCRIKQYKNIENWSTKRSAGRRWWHFMAVSSIVARIAHIVLMFCVAPASACAHRGHCGWPLAFRSPSHSAPSSAFGNRRSATLNNRLCSSTTLALRLHTRARAASSLTSYTAAQWFCSGSSQFQFGVIPWNAQPTDRMADWITIKTEEKNWMDATSERYDWPSFEFMSLKKFQLQCRIVGHKLDGVYVWCLQRNETPECVCCPMDASSCATA